MPKKLTQVYTGPILYRRIPTYIQHIQHTPYTPKEKKRKKNFFFLYRKPRLIPTITLFTKPLARRIHRDHTLPGNNIVGKRRLKRPRDRSLPQQLEGIIVSNRWITIASSPLRRARRRAIAQIAPARDDNSMPEVYTLGVRAVLRKLDLDKILGRTVRTPPNRPALPTETDEGVGIVATATKFVFRFIFETLQTGGLTWDGDVAEGTFADVH